MKAYKLIKVRKNGTLGPLFINRRQILPIGEWLDAEEHPTKGYKYRPGWPTTATPDAPHLSMKVRAWYEIEIEDFEEFSSPKSQGGIWLIAKRMKVVKEYVEESHED